MQRKTELTKIVGILAGAVVLIGIGIVFGAALIRHRRGQNAHRQQVPRPFISPGSTRENQPTNLPTASVTPNEAQSEKPKSSDAIITLNDSARRITVDNSGNVRGLDDVPASTRDVIACMLLAKKLEEPAILRELGGLGGTIRKGRSLESFKLTSPLRVVVVSDQPTLKWEKASRASSYRVYVKHPASNEIAMSEELPPESTEWTLPKPLHRGEIYSWTVVAVDDGNEIVSPSPASFEAKFQVLSLSRLQELDRLRDTRSHLALGAFYASVGMISEAENQFRELVRLNPNSLVAKNLVRELRAMRKLGSITQSNVTNLRAPALHLN